MLQLYLRAWPTCLAYSELLFSFAAKTRCVNDGSNGVNHIHLSAVLHSIDSHANLNCDFCITFPCLVLLLTQQIHGLRQNAQGGFHQAI